MPVELVSGISLLEPILVPSDYLLTGPMAFDVTSYLGLTLTVQCEYQSLGLFGQVDRTLISELVTGVTGEGQSAFVQALTNPVINPQ